MAKKFYGSIDIQNAQSLIFSDADSSNFVALKAATTVGSNVTWTLPAVDSTGTQSLVSDGAGTLSWASFLSATLASGQIFVGNGSNVATAVTVTGDVTISNTGVTAIGSGVIVNADINAAAAIDLSKLAVLTTDRALVSSSSGVISPSAVTATELGYVFGVTSAIQTQLDGKASTALNNLTVASLAAESLLVGTSSSAVKALAVGSNGQTLQVVAGAVAWTSPAVASFSADWDTADTEVKEVTHNLGSKDVIVQIYDKTDDSTIEVDSVVRTSTNVVTVTASSAPGAAGWRVLILKV